MDDRLNEVVFAAGRIAVEQGWDEHELVMVESLSSIGPKGPPLIVCVPDELNAASAEKIAALVGAGRAVIAVCSDTPSPDVVRWLAPGVLHTVHGAHPARNEISMSDGFVSRTLEAGQPSRTQRNMWELVVGHRDPEVRAVAAAHPAAPADLLERLSADSDPVVLLAVARNPNATPAILRRLVADADAETRWAALAHPRIPRDVLRYEGLHAPCRAVGENPKTPSDVLTAMSTLFGHPSDEFDPSGAFCFERAAVASNPNTPEHVLRTLMRDPHSYVRARLVENPRLPWDLLSEATKNLDGDSLDDIADNPHVPGFTLREIVANGDATFVAKHPNMPVDLLRTLAEDDDNQIQECVALNPTTPEDVLRVMARSDDNLLRFSVARNPHTPEDLLTDLSKDTAVVGDYVGDDQRVCDGLAENPSAPADSLRRVAADANLNEYIIRDLGKNPNTPGDLLVSLVEDRGLRPDLAARHPNTPVEHLASLASRYPQEVASNPHTSRNLLLEIANGEDAVAAGIATLRLATDEAAL